MSRSTLASALALLALTAAALLVGEIRIPPAEIFESEVLWQIRAPRVAAALLVGAALAAAGAAGLCGVAAIFVAWRRRAS